MKRIIPVAVLSLLLFSSGSVIAAENMLWQNVALSAESKIQLDRDIHMLQKQWATIKYKPEAFLDEEEDGDSQEDYMEELAKKAAEVTARYPKAAEPKIWEAIIVSTQAGMEGGFGALGLVKKSKKLLEQAEKIDPNALDGSIYTSLGSLYYQVPGWPLGFGDDDKARAYLEQARAVNPNGIDPNYFYGDFLIEDGDYAQAIKVLEHALQASPRPNRPVADDGRREEIKQAIAKAKKKLGS